jgi:hypothetical protein
LLHSRTHVIISPRAKRQRYFIRKINHD